MLYKYYYIIMDIQDMTDFIQEAFPIIYKLLEYTQDWRTMRFTKYLNGFRYYIIKYENTFLIKEFDRYIDSMDLTDMYPTWWGDYDTFNKRPNDVIVEKCSINFDILQANNSIPSRFPYIVEQEHIVNTGIYVIYAYENVLEANYCSISEKLHLK